MQTKRQISKYDQEYLYSLNMALCNNIEQVLEYLDIESMNFSNYRSCKCPIHDGDNATGLTIYPENEPYGWWQCNTASCHKYFYQNIIGLVHGVLSARQGWNNKNGKRANFDEVLTLCKGMVGHVKIDKISTKNKLLSEIKVKEVKNSGISREDIRKKIKIPSPFFAKDFRKETLDHFDVGEGNIEGMENRAIVPIYDENFFFIGCQGRHINGGLPKWKNSKDLPLESTLYNLNAAKPHIAKSKTIILVEGPKDVWRLFEAGIKNVVALLGGLKNGQKILLETSGALHIKCMFDNDDAGEADFESVYRKCKRLFHVSQIKFGVKGDKQDPADLSVEEIKNIFSVENICF